MYTRFPIHSTLAASDVHQESASTSAAKKAMQMAEEQIQVLKKENELLGSTIKKLHSDVEQLVDELNIERRGRKEGSGAVIEEVTMAKRRAKFLEGELAKAKSRLNCTIVELDQVFYHWQFTGFFPVWN